MATGDGKNARVVVGWWWWFVAHAVTSFFVFLNLLLGDVFHIP